MRIRKRLALCSSPKPPPLLSDLQLRRSEAAPPSSQPCDPPKQTSDQTNGWVFPKYQENIMKQKEFGDDVNTNNDIRKIVSICRGEDGLITTNMQPSSSSFEEEEDYKLVPLKKRKGTFERNPNDETASAKMKSKTNKKYGDDAVAFDRKPAVEEDGTNSSCSSGAKKSRRRGNVIMEGSRCSRVNGRGWRCCQPTLVGYSLCEHHLGKGRLRSMANVRRQQPANDEGNLQPLITKKRSKVGVVKARSMSSLLSQI